MLLLNTFTGSRNKKWNKRQNNFCSIIQQLRFILFLLFPVFLQITQLLNYFSIYINFLNKCSKTARNLVQKYFYFCSMLPLFFLSLLTMVLGCCYLFTCSIVFGKKLLELYFFWILTWKHFVVKLFFPEKNFVSGGTKNSIKGAVHIFFNIGYCINSEPEAEKSTWYFSNSASGHDLKMFK